MTLDEVYGKYFPEVKRTDNKLKDKDFIEIPETPIKEPAPIKPLPQQTQLVPVQKKRSNIRLVQIIIGIVIGIIIAFLLIQYYPQITMVCENIANESYIYGAAYGIEYVISTITNEASQCNQIPMNYSNYSYTLISLECSQQNPGGAQ